MLGKKSYKDYAASHAPASHMAGNCARAFLFGGGICVLAQALCALYSMLGASEENARLCSTFTLIVLAALLTSLDVFDTIAEHAGAGTLVPITGFSNAISAEAISARSEGFITGHSLRNGGIGALRYHLLYCGNVHVGSSVFDKTHRLCYNRRSEGGARRRFLFSDGGRPIIIILLILFINCRRLPARQKNAAERKQQ